MLKAEYEKMFESHEDDLKMQRQAIEQAFAKESVPVQLLTTAHDKIRQFHVDKEAFRKSGDVYAKDDKDEKTDKPGKGKAKGKGGGQGQGKGKWQGGERNSPGAC